MVEKISNYAQTIILLTIGVTIIELLLPKGNNKKYAMLMCSLVIMLAVISPIINVFNEDFDVSLVISEVQEEMKDLEYSSVNNYDLQYNIYNTYLDNLSSNIENRLQEMGYRVLESKINVDKTTYEPLNIEMKVEYDDGYIQPIIIDVFENISSNKLYDVDVNKIKDILSINYGVDKENIKINE